VRPWPIAPATRSALSPSPNDPASTSIVSEITAGILSGVPRKQADHEEAHGEASEADSSKSRKRKEDGEHVALEVSGRELRVSKPDKLFFPEPGFTKMDLIAYYIECEQAVVRHLSERPTVMKRWVDGV